MGTASVTTLLAPVSRVPRLLRSTVGRNVRIRPLKFADLDILMPTVGVLVDSLYPRGAEKLLARLEDALNGYAVAHVAEVSDFGPVALASETLKGDSRVKLSTFWVHRRFRGLGIGSSLLDRRIEDWCLADRDHAIVTVREDRAAELERLFVPRGFSRIAVDLNRYGEGRSEVVLKWVNVGALSLISRRAA